MKTGRKFLSRWQLGAILICLILIGLHQISYLEAREIVWESDDLRSDDIRHRQKDFQPPEVILGNAPPQENPETTPSDLPIPAVSIFPNSSPPIPGVSDPNHDTQPICQSLPLTNQELSFQLASLSQGRYGWQAQAYSQNLRIGLDQNLKFWYRATSFEQLRGFGEPLITVWLDDELISEFWLSAEATSGDWQQALVPLSDWPAGEYQITIVGGNSFDQDGLTDIEVCGLELTAALETASAQPPTISNLRVHQLAEQPRELTLSWQLVDEDSLAVELPLGWSYDWRVSSQAIPQNISDHEWRLLEKPELIIRPGLGLISAPGTNHPGLQLVSLRLPSVHLTTDLHLALRLQDAAGAYQSKPVSLKITSPSFSP